MGIIVIRKNEEQDGKKPEAKKSYTVIANIVV